MAATQTIEKTETLVLAPEQQDSKSYDVFDLPVAVERVEEDKPAVAVEVATELSTQFSFLSGSIRLVGQLVRPFMAVYGWMGGPPKTGQQRHRQVMVQRPNSKHLVI